MSDIPRYWLEAGAILHFVKQPNKSHIPRLGQAFVSIEVVKAEDHDKALQQREREIWEQAAKLCTEATSLSAEGKGTAMTSDFETELSALLNRCSMENISGTPDFILATYLIGCLKAYEGATLARDAWHDGGASV